MDEETLQNIEKGKSQMCRGRLLGNSKSHEAALGTEADEMLGTSSNGRSYVPARNHLSIT